MEQKSTASDRMVASMLAAAVRIRERRTGASSPGQRESGSEGDQRELSGVAVSRVAAPVSITLGDPWVPQGFSIVARDHGFDALVAARDRKALRRSPSSALFLCQLDSEFAASAAPVQLVDETPIPRWASSSSGIYAPLLSRVGEQFTVTGLRSDLLPDRRDVLVTARIEGQRLLPSVPFGFTGRKRIAGPVAPFPVNGDEWFIAGFSPVVVCRQEAGRAGLRPEVRRQAPPEAARLSPAAPGVDLGDGWLFLAVDGELSGRQSPAWRFVRIGRDFRLEGIGAPFCLAGSGGGTAGGLALAGEELAISFAESAGGLLVSIMPLAEVLSDLGGVERRAIPDLKPVSGDPRTMLRPEVAGWADVPRPDPPGDPSAVSRIVPAAPDVGPLWTFADDREIGRYLRERGTWGVGESRFIRDVVRPGMNVIDVGANLGYVSVMLSKLVGPEGSVLAIEAEPDNASLLRANLALNEAGNVEALRVAAHEQRGTMSIALFDGGNLGGFMFTGGEGTAVPAWPLDDLLDPEVPVGFIKVDVEGADHLAVAGLSRTIRRWRPTVMVEFAPPNTEKIGETPEAALAVYRRLGFRIMVIGESARSLIEQAGIPAIVLLDSGLAVEPSMEEEIIAAARRLGTLNLGLWPLGEGNTARA